VSAARMASRLFMVKPLVLYEYFNEILSDI
jgi:hypothetical protein